MKTIPLLAFLLLCAEAGTAEPVRTLSAAGVSVESAALLISGQQGGDLPFTALALPIRGEGEKVRVLLRLRLDGKALLAGQTRDVLRIEASLYALGTGGGIQGSLLETIEIDLAGLRGAVERDGVDLLGSLDLRPGAYILRLLARNLDTGRLGVRSLPLPVPDLANLDASPPLAAPPAEGDPRPTARSASLGPLDPPPFPDDPAGLASRAAPLPPAAPPKPLPDTAAGRQLRSAVRSAYRDAVARWAAGHEADAVAAVTAFEDSLLRTLRPGTVEQLVEIESGAAAELAAADPASLLPLLRLHQRLYQDVAVNRRLQGSTVAREVIIRLVDLYRQGSQPELARRFASVFGVELMRSGVRAQGGQMLQRVLAEDPGDETALLELAFDAERRGDHAQAAGYLEALLRAHPDNREARLRLTLDRARQGGRTGEAMEALRTFIQEEAGGWRLALAYQELARMQIAQGLPGAGQTLREGLARFPGDEKLTFLLAALLDKSGQRAEARQVLAGFKPEAGEGGGAARRRYSSPPREPLATVKSDLEREAAARLPALAAVLEKTAR